MNAHFKYMNNAKEQRGRKEQQKDKQIIQSSFLKLIYSCPPQIISKLFKDRRKLTNVELSFTS
jgi:hypothetical protein